MLLKEYKVIWRWPDQYGYLNYQTYECTATSKEEAKTMFRKYKGYNSKRIVRVEEYTLKRRY